MFEEGGDVFGEIAIQKDEVGLRAEVEACNNALRSAGVTAQALDCRYDEHVGTLATDVWHGVNLPNLRQHIAPVRALADLVVLKGADHAILDIAEGAGLGFP